MNARAVSVLRWFDSGAGQPPRADEESSAIRPARCVPFVLIHLGCLGVLWVGWSPVAGVVALAAYLVRMFAITGFYHRYFSHRSFSTGRLLQFGGAFLGASAAQRGPLWWAAHHRNHHRHADRAGDLHSPVHDGFWRSHCGWFLLDRNFHADRARVPDLARYPELLWMDRLDGLPPLLFAAGCWALGSWLATVQPSLGTSGPQLLVWGFFVSTTVLYHGTFTINSLAHRFGWRAYDTPDQSRNNLWLALITLGEGWHNNHHYHPGSARQGFRQGEIDVTYGVLRVLQAMGLVWNVHEVPERVLAAAQPRRRRRRRRS